MPKRRKFDIEVLRSWTYTAKQEELQEARRILDAAVKARFPIERSKKPKKAAAGLPHERTIT